MFECVVDSFNSLKDSITNLVILYRIWHVKYTMWITKYSLRSCWHSWEVDVRKGDRKFRAACPTQKWEHLDSDVLPVGKDNEWVSWVCIIWLNTQRQTVTRPFWVLERALFDPETPWDRREMSFRVSSGQNSTTWISEPSNANRTLLSPNHRTGVNVVQYWRTVLLPRRVET